MPDEFEYYSERRAAIKAGVNRLTLRRHREAGRIRPLILSHTILYSAAEIERWKKANPATIARGGKR